jgi:hypothetical protein
MNGTSVQSEHSPGVDRPAAGTGLALLQLRAKPDWIHRQLMDLAFVDTRMASWRVSCDFFLPGTAPTVSVGNELIRLIPIADLPRGEFPVVSQCDGQEAPVWQPAPAETAQ